MSERIYKNQLALDEAQKQERVRVDALLARVQRMEAQHQMLVTEVTSLRQMLAQVLVSRGHGATAREAT
jgi:hypothetical protein